MSHINCLKRLKKVIFSFVLIPSLFLFLFSILLSDTTYAQTAGSISLQGKIVRNDTGYEGLNVVNGTPSCVAVGTDTCNFKVSYYSASTAGTLYYSESFSGVEIGDYGGVFNLKLGSGTTVAGGSLSSTAEVLGTYKDVYMEIAFDPAGGTTYGEVFTRTALSASAYAMSAGADSFGFYNTNDAGESSLAATTGAVYYNTTDGNLKVYDGSSWVAIGAGGATWGTSDVTAYTNYDGYFSSTGIGTFSDFTLDLDHDRLSINTAQKEGGLSIYSSYATAGSDWPLVSFKAANTGFDASILELTQYGSGDIILGFTGSTPSFQVDYLGDLHLANNGIAYFEPFGTLPTSGSLNPNTGEGCMYSSGGNLYWDPSCDGTAAALSTGAASLWTDGGTFTYLTSTTDDLVLGSSTTGTSAFFFDVSEKRLGIGTDTPQAAIDIAGASSSISNSSGDITIDATDQLVLLSDVELGNGSTTRSLYAYNATRTYYGQLELYNLATGNLSLTTTFATGDIVLNTGGDVVFTGGGLNLSDNWSNVFGENLSIWGNSNSDIYLQPDAGMGDVGIGTTSASAKLDVQGTADSVQLSVKGYSTQTNNILEVKKSDASSILTLSNTGLLTLSGNFLGGTNNSYDIGTTSTRWKDVYTQGQINIGASGDSGSVRYNTTNDELEFSNDGSTWIPLADAIKTTTLSAEYPGAVLAADGTANVGFMTSDAEGSASNSMNYYEWNSSESTLQDYDVRLRFTIPHDFSSWGTNAFTLNLATEAAASTNNKVDIYVYEESSGTVDDSSVAQYSGTAGVWQTTTIQGADLGDCNAAGETCLILIRMYSANDNYVRVGDIDVNYNRKL